MIEIVKWKYNLQFYFIIRHLISDIYKKKNDNIFFYKLYLLLTYNKYFGYYLKMVILH